MIDDEMDQDLKLKAARLVELASKPDPSLSSIKLITGGKQVEEVSDDENEQEER